MSEELGLFEAMNTQRAIRYLKPDPVPDEMLTKLIEAATKAPSGTNQQKWHFLVIKDESLRKQLGEYYRLAGEAVLPALQYLNTENPRLFRSASHLIYHMHEAPVLILACIQHAGSTNLTTGSSIYPAVQNILLAARALGLGSALTTFHKRFEGEIKELLGIPENVETAALLPIGYPSDGVRYGPTNRKPFEEALHWDRWNAEK